MTSPLRAVLCVLALQVPCIVQAKPLQDPIKLDSGYIAGTVIGTTAQPVRVYRGIPYAAPPVGELRWKEPQPVQPWTGVRETTKFAPWAAQRYPSAAVFEVATDADMSEDCLYLNVLTPAKNVGDRLPVLVWFHGGGLDTLSGNMLRYNTPQLAQTGALVVTVTHRLAAFGYLAHPWLAAESAKDSSGHYGNLDLIQSLRWVQSNIAAFGGDPKRVTIFGQSGGGRKVNFMMTSPIVPDGLFHRAIAQSSSINTVSRSTAEKNGSALVEALGVKDLAELRAKPWREIVAAAAKTRFSGQLVEDGWALTEPVTQSFADGDQKNVPYMIGMVATEDAGHFNVPVQLVPTIKQRGAPVFAYSFTAVPAGWRNDGVTGWHAIDITYLFGDARQNFGAAKPEYFRAYAQTQGAKNQDPGMTAADIKFAAGLQRIWQAFAATGNPNVAGLLSWPAYQTTTDNYLELDNSLAVKAGYSKLQHRPAPGARAGE